MNSEIISLVNITKVFYKWHVEERSGLKFLSNLFSQKRFTPLENISLKVNKGDQIAVVGKNGAGKTLLLKIISGIISPTSGELIVSKNISPIFEYGAGFHFDLTGADNIFLYGALLGIKRKEIISKISHIISFGELEKFIDMKLKYYSVGMRLRLAFSVASLLEPEILILDESLSFGDQGFVKKVHKKMEELQEKNTTMLITSHSTELLKKFCKKGIVLKDNKIGFSGNINEAIKFYDEII